MLLVVLLGFYMFSTFFQGFPTLSNVFSKTTPTLNHSINQATISQQLQQLFTYLKNNQFDDARQILGEIKQNPTISTTIAKATNKQNGFTALMQALVNPRTPNDIIKTLVQMGTPLRHINHKTASHIHCAAKGNHHETLSILLPQDFENIVNLPMQPDGIQPIHIAAQEGHIEMIIALAANGANINCQNSHGQTPLHYAVEREQIKALLTLLWLGAERNVQDAQGWTPLHFAAEKSKNNCVAILQSFSADPTLINNNGLTPEALANNAIKESMQKMPSLFNMAQKTLLENVAAIPKQQDGTIINKSFDESTWLAIGQKIEEVSKIYRTKPL